MPLKCLPRWASPSIKPTGLEPCVSSSPSPATSSCGSFCRNTRYLVVHCPLCVVASPSSSEDDGRRVLGVRAAGRGVRGQDHADRHHLLHHGGHWRSHVRLRRRNLRRRDIDGRFPGRVLPVGAAAEAAGQGEQLLQVRRPGPAALHVVPLPRRPHRHLLRLLHHPPPRPPPHHAHRRRILHRRRHLQRRRPEPGHAHRRQDPARVWRRFRQPGCSAVPVRDRADADPRRAQHPVPAERDHRHPLREPRELRHQQDPPLGLAPLAVPGRHPGGAPHPGRALRDRHPQQPHRARPPRRGQGGAQEDPRHRQRRARVQRDRGGEPDRAGGEAPVPEPPPAPQPSPARHRGAPPDLPAVHRDQRHHVLRPRALQHARVQERRVALLGGDHRRRQRAVDARVGVLRRQGRAAGAAAGGRRADVLLPGGGRRRAGDQGDGQVGQPGQRLGHPGGGHDLHLRGGVRVVVGPAGVAHPQRDLPAGDAVGGAERDGVRQPGLHLPHRAGVPLHALPPQVRHLHLLLGVGARHVHFRALLPPGDQERAHRGDDREGLEAALVLEAVHGRRPPPHRQRQRQRQARRLRLSADQSIALCDLYLS